MAQKNDQQSATSNTDVERIENEIKKIEASMERGEYRGPKVWQKISTAWNTLKRGMDRKSNAMKTQGLREWGEAMESTLGTETAAAKELAQLVESKRRALMYIAKQRESSVHRLDLEGDFLAALSLVVLWHCEETLKDHLPGYDEMSEHEKRKAQVAVARTVLKACEHIGEAGGIEVALERYSQWKNSKDRSCKTF